MKDVVTGMSIHKTNIPMKIMEDIIERGNTGKRADVMGNGKE